MKRTLVHFVAGSALTLCAVSGALAKDSTPYLSIGGGANFADDVSDLGLTLELDTGFTVFTAVGYDFGPGYWDDFRAEAELSWTENDAKVVGLSGDVTQFGAMAQGYYDFAQDGVFNPYIGAGLGIVHGDATVGSASGEGTDFAARAMLGVSFAIHKNAALDVGYRYTHVFDDPDLQNHGVTAAIRFSR